MNSKKKILISLSVFILLILLRIFVAFLTFNSGGGLFGYMQYLRLSIQDKFFWRILINSFLPHLLATLLCVFIVAFIRNLRAKKAKNAFFDRRYLPCAFSVLFLINRVIVLLVNIFVIYFVPKYIITESIGSINIPFVRYLLNTVLVTFISPQGLLDAGIYSLLWL
jgi:ABC-type Fe3+ transport system permease subunit